MLAKEGGPESTGKLFARYAAISLVPVVALGAMLAYSYQGEARRRGRAEARSEAILVAHTAIEPVLDGHPLDAGLSPSEADAARRVVDGAVAGGSVLRLRLRDLHGRAVFSDDGSGLNETPDDEALEAAGGELVSTLTHMNADTNDNGPRGVRAVEVYMPVSARSGGAPVGVLEMYLPYAPIERDVTAGLHSLYRNLAGGLAILYLALLAITVSVSRGLRRLVSANAFLAEHDPLTELPNRTLFHRRANQAIANRQPHEPAIAIAIVDLDRFKEINDTLGHHNGDRVLTGLADRLRAHMRPDDTVARLGGDEFGVILRDVADPEVAFRRLREIIDADVELSGLPISIEASIGFALAPEDGSGADELLQRADVAMYAAKNLHAGVLRYAESQDQYDAANLALIAELRHGIDAGELILHYQPKATMPGGHIEAVEALVRWQHPKLGLLAPDRFLPLAEQTDIIDQLTAWVLEAALTEIGGLDPDGEMAVAVNVSARNLSKAEFAAQVLHTLARVGMPASRLIIEITETALLADPTRAAETLRRLSEAGVRISIDDFGQGQTSLRYLAALPVHELKIDRSFVHDMFDNCAHRAIVQSIIELGHNLRMQVVAEGVETDEVLDHLQEAGCDIAQGFLLARPMPAEQLAAWLPTVVGPVVATR